MPILRGGEYIYDDHELAVREENPSRAEDKPGHKPLHAYNLPKWVYHPDRKPKRIVIEKDDYFGQAADGSRNHECNNVAHVAAYHDDIKLLSLATEEQCREPNKWGMTPTHMCGAGQHPYGPSLSVLYELVQMGAADPDAVNLAHQTPWHVCQRMHMPNDVKMFEKVLLKGQKPKNHDEKVAAALRARGKFAKAVGAQALADAKNVLPVMLVFPGQGSQYVGMLRDLQNFAPVKDMLETATKVLGYDILDICLNGPMDKLSQTKFCQPAMFIAGLAAVEKLKMDEPEKVSSCQALAGHSLGEYTALALAGVFSFEDGLKLVKARGEAMEFETTKPGATPQAMMSVAGLERDKIEKLCKECAQQNEVCQIANYLFPKGFSVAGNIRPLEELEKKAMQAGALQAKVLKTSAAFHTPIMAPARQKLLAALAEIQPRMQPPRCSVYTNLNGKPLGPSSSVTEIVTALGDQLTNPVRWEQSMQQAIRDGCVEFYECGPGQQLKAMMKRIDPKISSNMTSVAA